MFILSSCCGETVTLMVGVPDWKSNWSGWSESKNADENVPDASASTRTYSSTEPERYVPIHS